MHLSSSSVVVAFTTLLCVRTVRANFYNDGPLEFPTEEERSIGELERKWGTDVCAPSFSFLASFMGRGQHGKEE